MKLGLRALAAGLTLVVVVGAVAAMSKTRERPSNTSAPTRLAAASTASDTERVAIGVAGMYCASCETTVRTMLKRTPGVIATEVNVDSGRALVTYDATRTTPAKLADVINRLGYKATLPAPETPKRSGDY